MRDHSHFALLIRRTLAETHANFANIVKGDALAVSHQGTSFGALTNDIELNADRRLGQHLRKLWQADHYVSRITIEGRPDDYTKDEEGVWVCIDPLDGSLNFLKRGGTHGFPFCAVITVLRKVKGVTFADIIAAGVMDYRTGEQWIAEQETEGQFMTRVHGTVATPETAQVIDLGKMVVIGEMYYPENRHLLVEMFPEKGWLRNPGSAAYEMASVASGQAAAYICDRQKQHELGAAFALVKGAGGWVSDLEGNPLDNVPFTFNTQTPVILAGNEALGRDLVARVRPAQLALAQRWIGAGLFRARQDMVTRVPNDKEPT